jgi:hypothetical protein
MKKATIPAAKYLPVIPEVVNGQIYCLITDCWDFDSYQKLPAVINYLNEDYTRTGWCSEKHAAYYKTDNGLQLALFK